MRWACPSVYLFVCLSVCRQTAKTRFSQKLSNLKLWSLLATYRKSYTGFSKPHATLQGAVTWRNQYHDCATLQCVIIPSAILKIVFRHIICFCFLKCSLGFDERRLSYRLRYTCFHMTCSCIVYHGK